MTPFYETKGMTPIPWPCLTSEFDHNETHKSYGVCTESKLFVGQASFLYVHENPSWEEIGDLGPLHGKDCRKYIASPAQKW